MPWTLSSLIYSWDSITDDLKSIENTKNFKFLKRWITLDFKIEFKIITRIMIGCV